MTKHFNDSLDPRTRLVVVFSFTAVALLCNSLSYLVPIFMLMVIISINGKNSILSITKRFRWLIGFFVFIAVMQSGFNPTGKILLELEGIPLFTVGGLTLGGIFLCRIGIIMLSAQMLKQAGSRQMIQGLVQWKVPYELAFMTSTALHFIPIFQEEMQNALTAIQLRGIVLNRISIGNRIKIYSYLFMPVIVSMVVKAKELALAMEMRGFRMHPKRTSYVMLQLKKGDYLVMSTAIVMAVFIMGFYFMS